MPRWRDVLAQLLSGRRGALAIPLVLSGVLLLLPELGATLYWQNQLELIAIYALVVSGLNLTFGYCGEVQFGQVLVFALGAYLAAAVGTKDTADIVVLMLIGGVAAAVAGTAIALPALRIGGWSLAMTSFFLVITIPDLVDIFSKYTGGDGGLTAPIPSLFGTTLSNVGLYHVTIAALVVWGVCFRNFVVSRYGIIMRVVRESPVLTASLGFSPARVRVLVYALGAFPAGVAGCLFAFASEYVSPSTFGLALAIGFVASSVLGGTASVYGCVVGAAIFQLGPNASLNFQQYAPVAYGAFLIVAAILLPAGLSGVGRTWLRRIVVLLTGRPAPGASADAGPAGLHASDHGETVQQVAKAVARLGLHPAAQPLSIDGVSKTFGGVCAVRDLSLKAEPGKVTALIGSNGSGKTTVLNLISGYLRADGGTITFASETITGYSPHKIARLRFGRTFQTPSVPRDLTVADVVRCGRYHLNRVGPLAAILRSPRARRARRDDHEAATAALAAVGLSELADEQASTLSLGTRRLLEVARALCGGASVLLLDEPASGLSGAEVEVLGRAVRAAADAGAIVMIIEHNFPFVVSISDVVHVMHEGQLIASGDGRTVGRNPRVIESYLGSTTGMIPIDPKAGETEVRLT